MINKFLLEHKDFTDIPYEDIALIRQRDARRLQVMEGYCRTSGCLRNYILGTLLGADRARLKELGTTGYKTYGALKNRSESKLRLLISQLLVDGYSNPNI